MHRDFQVGSRAPVIADARNDAAEVDEVDDTGHCEAVVLPTATIIFLPGPVDIAWTSRNHP